MTNFEKIKLMSKDALADWLDKLSEYSDEAPWLTWFTEEYCDKCDPIKGTYKGSDRTHDFAYCELHDNCKYFPNEDMSIPTNLIKKWFEQEAK